MRRINYKSDIPPLLLSLKVDEKQITVPDCDFLVRFYIDGYEGRHYDCSHIGGVWSNCEPSEDGTKLVCYVNNQRLGIGELCAEFHYMSPDMRYSDGSQKSVVIIGSTELGVELVEDNGDAVTEAAIDVTLPFIYRTAYEIARDHGYTGTAEDFYGALASVVGIADAEKKRVTAEITRNANEQERIENEENRLNAESDRVNAEAQRVRNEAIRGEGENTRVEQEEDRKAKFEEITEFIATVRANEGNRESNERERQANEDTRITEESKRVEAEKRRATEFEQQKLDLGEKIDRSGDEMGGDLIFTDNIGVSFRTSDGGAHSMFNDTDDVAKFTADNGDTFEFTQDETPNKNSLAVVVSANLYNALDMALDSMGSALDGDAVYRVEAGDTIFNPDTCKIQRYNSTVGGFEDLCDPIDGKLYANKMTGYIYRWEPKTKKMVFVGGVKAYTKDEADSRFAKLKDETQTVNVKELNANNFISAKSMWIGDEGLLLNGDGNGHLTVEQDEVITDVTLNEKLATKADDVAYGVEWNNGQPTGELEETTIKEATKSTTVTALLLAQSYNALEYDVKKKADKTELDSYATKEYVQTNAPKETKESIEEKLGAWLEDDGGEADGEVYTKAESDARYLRGEVIYEDYYYPNMGKTTDKVMFTDSTEILQPTKFLESYTDANDVSWNDVFECEGFPDWFDYAEKACYPYSNGVSVGRPFFKNYTLKDGELVYKFNALIDNNNIAQKLPFFDNNIGLRKIDATHFNVYSAKNAVTEFNILDKANVDCSLFAFGPIVNMRTYDIDDCKKVRITLIGNVEPSNRYNKFNKTGEILFNSYLRHQVICGNEYVEIEIDKSNNRYRYVANGYSLSYRDNYNKNWNQLTQKTYQSKCFSDWINIINAHSFYIVKIGGKICYSFNTHHNPSNFLQMGCKIKIEKLA